LSGRRQARRLPIYLPVSQHSGYLIEWPTTGWRNKKLDHHASMAEFLAFEAFGGLLVVVFVCGVVILLSCYQWPFSIMVWTSDPLLISGWCLLAISYWVLIVSE